jgi:hypothetical protein
MHLRPYSNYSNAAKNSSVVPASIEFIRATSGELTLTRPEKLHRIIAIKVDAGEGVAAFKDLSGALFNGQPGWELRRQYEWAIFIWDGAAWDVFSTTKKISQLVAAAI